MAENKSKSGVVMIGLGGFGSSLALELAERDLEVLGIDSSVRIVQSLAGRLTHVVTVDSTAFSFRAATRWSG